jgi:hypothetical protein
MYDVVDTLEEGKVLNAAYSFENRLLQEYQTNLQIIRDAIPEFVNAKSTLRFSVTEHERTSLINASISFDHPDCSAITIAATGLHAIMSTPEQTIHNVAFENDLGNALQIMVTRGYNTRLAYSVAEEFNTSFEDSAVIMYNPMRNNLSVRIYPERGELQKVDEKVKNLTDCITVLTEANLLTFSNEQANRLIAATSAASAGKSIKKTSGVSLAYFREMAQNTGASAGKAKIKLTRPKEFAIHLAQRQITVENAIQYFPFEDSQAGTFVKALLKQEKIPLRKEK